MPLVFRPHPVLSQISSPVQFDDPTLPDLIADMMAVVAAGNTNGPALGLAANQVGAAKRVIIAGGAFLNPLWTPWKDGKMEGRIEGCLSWPGGMEWVKRHYRINIKYTSRLDGSQITSKLSGLDARVWQHECDHIDGVSIWDLAAEAPRKAPAANKLDMVAAAIAVNIYNK